jgi:ABC-type transport system substrate-binding protein
LEQKPVGSGAFIQKSFTPNVDIVYDKNPDYFKKDSLGKQLPYMDGWRAIVQPLPEVRLQTFLGEQADMLLSTLVAGDAQTTVREIIKQAPNARFQVVPSGWGLAAISGKREEPIWNDIRVRRAFSMLLPRESMIKNMFKGAAGAWPEFPWGFLFESPPQLKDMGKWWEFNPKEAKALLDAAGVGDKEWNLEYYDAPTSQVSNQILILQDEAGKAGVKITLAKQPDYPTILSRMAGRQFKDLSFHHHNQPLFIDPAGTMVDFVAGQPQNQGFSRANDATYNEFYRKLSETPVGPARTALGKQVWDYHLDQVMELSLLVGIQPATQHPRVQNWVNTAWAEKYVALGCFDSVWLDPAKKLKS